ncbi:DUF418 domain-containing protein [Lentimicrobium sp. L6]|uniref:DUF418 domain-containing protein n=1 Tax=Lentimicrobium sp. L6 TaxID=2735916 RepID=UPI0015552AB0|nr:DUF418 domain-containing protein [Lentimicrobium sp. L6]NPD84687.1 DUF418 domain-containing protein [Lentimicrobium sp. L6]
MSQKKPRIVIVDALRGFALLGIILIHSIEHFDFFYPPELNYLFSPALDGFVFETIFLLIAGKAYSIFALMFGFSFFIQMDRQKQLGIDFRAQFIWRLFILMGLGFVHSLFYEGDILHIYAILGMSLVLFDRFKTKHLIIIAGLLALQIPTLVQLTVSLLNPNYIFQETFGAGLWGIGSEIFAKGSFFEVIEYNNWRARTAVWGWTFYNGRYLMLIALFIFGLVLGREQFFHKLKENKKTLEKIALITFVFSVVIIQFKTLLITLPLGETQSYFLNVLLGAYTSFTHTFFIFSVFCLIYIKFSKAKAFNYLAVYGRMSLSNYAGQSMIGVFIFYGYGLGMYRFMGSSWSLIYGILFFILQVSFSQFWMRNYYYGPLEWLWRALTQLDFSIPLKRKTINSKT